MATEKEVEMSEWVPGESMNLAKEYARLRQEEAREELIRQQAEERRIARERSSRSEERGQR